ncbi:hypothetical protein HOD29_00320 [archaeon]|jgi:hypothetical protein|nr:hypothetical protein [archaeon]
MPGNAIHLKLEYSEAISNRKEVLSAEINTLQLVTTIRAYHKLRAAELNKKVEMQKKLKSINANINKLSKLLPILKIPKILKKTEEVGVETHKEFSPKITKISSHPLEDELKKIKNELSKLEAKA